VTADDLWVFGYGSLIWRPGFDFAERQKARVAGFHRSLCVRSFVHRGTPERPGLVFGLDRGGACVGMAFRVPAEEREPVLAYLRERELPTNVYKERILAVRLADGRSVHAVAFVVDRGHAQYGGKIAASDAAVTVARSHGRSGPNVEYVVSVHAELKAMGIADRWLDEVVARLPHVPAAGATPPPGPLP
jgi:glutathione-specific gamma-glutamylcyclotransferase